MPSSTRLKSPLVSHTKYLVSTSADRSCIKTLDIFFLWTKWTIYFCLASNQTSWNNFCSSFLHKLYYLYAVLTPFSLGMILSLLPMEIPPLLAPGWYCPVSIIIIHIYVYVSMSFPKIIRENTDKCNLLQPLALLSKMPQPINRLLCLLLSVRKSVKAAILGKAAESWRNTPFTTWGSSKWKRQASGGDQKKKAAGNKNWSKETVLFNDIYIGE